MFNDVAEVIKNSDQISLENNLRWLLEMCYKYKTKNEIK